MTDQDGLEELLADLAADLDSRPSLAARVMREVGCQPHRPEPVGLAKHVWRWTDRTVPLKCAVSFAVLAAMIVAAVVLVKPGNLEAQISFAEVRRTVREVDTGVLWIEYTNAPHRNHKLMMSRRANRIRAEWRNGITWIVDAERGRWLVLNSQDKTAAVVSEPPEAIQSVEMLNRLAGIEELAADGLGTRKIDGRELVGFEVDGRGNQQGKLHYHVWVDPKTRLPVRIDAVPVAPQDPLTSHLQSTTTVAFNEPLDESLFTLTPPEGYTQTEAGAPPIPSPEPSEGKDLPCPIIRPGVGIGPARFGMDVKQVTWALGKPDKTEESKRGASIKLSYDSLGYTVSISKKEGFKSASCEAGNPYKSDFTGRTAEGITIGASRQDIEKTYGKADLSRQYPFGEGSRVDLAYKSLGLLFGLNDDRLVNIGVFRPRE